MSENKNDKEKEKPAARPGPDDDVVGKVYDGRLMRRLLRYLLPYKLQTALSAVSILLKGFTDIAGPLLVMSAVDIYLRPDGTWLSRHLSPHLSPVPFTGITELAALFCAALCISLGLDFVQTYLMQWTGQKIMFDLRSQIFRHIQDQDVGFFDRNPVGRLVTRVTSDVDAINEMFTSGVLAIFDNVITLTFIVVIMLFLSWPLALVTLAVIPLIILATNIFRKYVRVSYRSQRAATARINAFTQEYVSGMSVVQLFNRERRAFDDFSAVNRENKQAWSDAIFAYALYYPIVEFLSSLAIASVIWFGCLAVSNTTALTWLSPHTYLIPPHGDAVHWSLFGDLVSIGILIAFIQYAQRFFRPIQELSDKFNILQAAMAASERVFKLLDQTPEIVSPPSTIAPSPNSPDYGSIEFRNVWFTYQKLDLSSRSAAEGSAFVPDATQDPAIEWILRDVSFKIHPNETAAIVGHTGAGKTTITSLMMRFYDIQMGQILVDGVDVRDQDLTALRQRFGVVLQDPFLFSGTIMDNIRLGTSRITDRRVEQAAEEVNVADFIRTLPLAFQEPVRERGAGLSTGQKQLISFARALSHDPGILILDEATSSVDTETELRVRLALSRMITGRTSVLIAHRLSTIQSADTILVMHKGQLREQGTHQQLLAERGLYYKLYQLQYQDQELTISA
jgi:ATP-binding cassette subfamily B multidrug efflux pump